MGRWTASHSERAPSKFGQVAMRVRVLFLSALAHAAVTPMHEGEGAIQPLPFGAIHDRALESRAASLLDASATPIDVFVMDGEYPEVKQPQNVVNYLSDVLKADQPAYGNVPWRIQKVPVDETATARSNKSADEAFFDAMLPRLQPGSVVVLTSLDLQHPGIDEKLDARIFIRESPLRSMPRLWKLLNVSVPLQIILYLDPGCGLEWPNSTHHVLYRTMWCNQTHAEWLASREREPALGSGSGGELPWLRSFPFMTSYNDGKLGELEELQKVGVASRGYLWNYVGSLTYEKPTRQLLKQVVEREWSKFDEVAQRIMQGAPPRPAGERFVFNVSMTCYADSTSVCTKTPKEQMINLTFSQLLGDSVLCLCPAGDMWDSYRMWEAMEAGTIPVVDDMNQIRYKSCDGPSGHFLYENPYAISYKSPEELPALLESLAAQPGGLAARQKGLIAWLAQHKAEKRQELLSTAYAMRAATHNPAMWKPRTQCTIERLSPEEVANENFQLAQYWRRPQNFTDSPYLENLDTKHGMYGRRNWSANKTVDPDEPCLSAGCSPPLIHSITCGPQ
ncbi:hypothetical protein AB1Y20_012999 [Prymnesium parvum]|uniref:RXYLT1 C-terminal domain-containing protein n=1 Tax=Prymnesium parvum TaxID=97485 RepID=A0AB34IKA0_PRYPA